jgi:hypothetical protein
VDHVVAHLEGGPDVIVRCRTMELRARKSGGPAATIRSRLKLLIEMRLAMPNLHSRLVDGVAKKKLGKWH